MPKTGGRGADLLTDADPGMMRGRVLGTDLFRFVGELAEAPVGVAQVANQRLHGDLQVARKAVAGAGIPAHKRQDTEVITLCHGGQLSHTVSLISRITCFS